MGERIRAFDWSETPLGPVETWSPALRTMLRILLANRFPHILWWGPHYIQFYNDPYRSIPGAKHPHQALGRPASECWAEIWHVIGPLIDHPFHGGPATWDEDIHLEVNRHGFLEETHFTIAYSPVPDESAPGGIGGVLATVHEITEKVVGERRVVALCDLGARVGEAKSAEEACAIAAKTLAAHDKDIPFALLYLLDGDGKGLKLAGVAGVKMGEDISPAAIDLCRDEQSPWPIAQALQKDAPQTVENFGRHFLTVPQGPWSDPPKMAVVLPIPSHKAHAPAGMLIAGVSARLKFDASYRDFFELVRAQAAAAIANARAYEEERKRAEALAALDRAKTAFFSNVSHEFRTPLTLMLGPLEDALADSAEGLNSAHRERLEIAHRNSLRLLKLVNTLLDFSRIEAGRIEANYEPADLAAYTTELASVFRSAIEKAGLELTIDCPALAEKVYVDRQMWEKIVLNLLSNAFKFTFEGAIKVALRWRGERVELSVADTGVGIPGAELAKIFERFHRVRDARGRTQEGTGIGLALVQELARLHGGEVKVQSEEAKGSTFTVSIRTGTAHLPQDRISAPSRLDSTGVGAAPFIEEALRWLPDEESREELSRRSRIEDGEWQDSRRSSILHPPSSTARASRPRVLWADDNADMRDYVRRLLTPFYEVEAVGDGQSALRAARARPPDLILADIMMPVMDGFALLRALRTDPALNTIPVIMLSARAGEEARIEGLDSGADDYLIKPFSARELLARVESQLKLGQLRRENEERVRQVNDVLAARITDLNNARRAALSLAEDATVAEQSLRESEGLLAGQKEALQTALNGEPLESSLGVLVRTATEQLGPDARAAFYLANAEGTSLHHVIGMPESYAEQIDGFKIGPESRACGLATHTGQPVLTSDVTKDPLWQPWLGLAEHFDYRGCWSFPIRTSGGKFVGTFAVYWRQPREATARDLALAGILTDSAAIIISRHAEAEERQRAQEKLRESEERLAGILRQASVGLAQTDLTGRFLLVNDRFCEVAGRSRDEILRMRMQELTHPDDLERNLALFEQTVQTGADFVIEKRYLRPDGSAVWVNNSVYAVRGADGRPEYIVAVSLDITDRKKAEREIKKLMQELEERVAERTAELRQANAALVRDMGERRKLEGQLLQAQKMESLGILAGGIAHDFNNILNIIHGHTFLLQEHGARNREIAESLAVITATVRRGAGLVKQLLTLARKTEARFEAVEAHRLIEGMIALLRETLPKTIVVRAELAADCPPIMMDRSQFEQALLNLAMNARDAMPKGGSLVFRTAIVDGSHARDLGAGDAERYLCVEVGDTGMGMTESVKKQIFEPFFTTKEVGRGTGLGLSVVYGIAKNHKGFVTVESKPMAGTAFRLYFPIASALETPAADRAEAAGPGATAAQTKICRTILLVEDEQNMLYVLHKVLPTRGYRVVSATDGQTALAIYERQQDKIDAVLLDLGLPRLAGQEVLLALQEKNPQVKVIVASGYIDPDVKALMTRLGVQYFLDKPYVPSQVIQTLDSLLDTHAHAL